MLRANKLLACAIPLSMFVACASEGPDLDLSDVDMPIINGQAPDAPRHNATVALYITKRNGTYLCSGTLIRDKFVGTAAHCLWDRRGPVGASAVTVFIGNTVSGGIRRPVSAVSVHPGYVNSSLGVNDVALLELATAVPACTATGLTFPACADPVRELPPVLALNASDIGVLDGIDFAGFGKTATGSSGVKLHAFGELGGFGCSVSGCSNTGNPTTQFSYAQVVDGPCSGDSGGTAFVQRSGVWYDAGPTSWGDSACTSFGVSMRWDAYASFVVSVAGCSSGADCNDGNECTTDACSSGACQHAEVTCADDGNLCTTEVCVPGTGCTSSPVNCDDGQACTSEVCVAELGCQITDMSGPPCSDGNACTVDDICGGGQCLPGAPSTAPACSCGAKGASCTSDAGCCSGTCRGQRCR